MSEPARHCPFLNRSDDRCASHFSLDHLSDAMDQCASAYGTCGVYQELLLERRVRRAEASLLMNRREVGDVGREPPAVTFVPLTLSVAGHRAGGAVTG